MFTFPECIILLTVTFTLSAATIILNAFTIIVFVKNRNLRKRSTYLLINLAIADILVGGFSTLDRFYFFGGVCNVWSYKSFGIGGPLSFLFLISSMTNIAFISLERLHATFWPFKHRVIKSWIYKSLITAVWVLSGLVTAAVFIVQRLSEGLFARLHVVNSFNAICLFVICVAYASILVKVRYGSQPQHHGAASRERRLTVTLLIVTFVSLFLWLPYIIGTFLFSVTDYLSSLSQLQEFRLNLAATVLFHANSFVNPILYIIIMREFRAAFLVLFRPRHQRQRHVQVFPLHDT